MEKIFRSWRGKWGYPGIPFQEDDPSMRLSTQKRVTWGKSAHLKSVRAIQHDWVTVRWWAFYITCDVFVALLKWEISRHISHKSAEIYLTPSMHIKARAPYVFKWHNNIEAFYLGFPGHRELNLGGFWRKATEVTVTQSFLETRKSQTNQTAAAPDINIIYPGDKNASE